ncbi:hypothetical protein MCEMSEM22_03534 [Comamonadaceae bacterium]
MPNFLIKARLKASALHLTASLAVALIAAILVFEFWFPYPYREISGGRELFLLLICVDVVLGPVLTFMVFDQRKAWSKLKLDLLAIVVLQVSALVYGLWTVSVARPVYLVFEIDRFRVVHAIDVPSEQLKLAPKGLTAMPYLGQTTLGLRPFKNEQEKVDFTLAALGGSSLAARPELWQNYADSKRDVINSSKPLARLKERLKDQSTSIDTSVKELGVPEAVIRYLPLISRSNFWTVLIDGRSGEIVGYLPIDAFE